MCVYLQVYRLVLQGQIDKVRGLLSHNSAANTEAFRSIDEVIRKMPLYNVSLAHKIVNSYFPLPSGENLA